MRAHPFAAALVFFVLAALALDGGLGLFRAAHERRAGFGGAQWIWISKAPKRAPVRFAAGSSFTLVSRPQRAVARVLAAPRFELWVNGSRAGEGGEGPGGHATSFDVAPLLREGANRAAIVAESSDGVGGILFALSDGAGRPIVVSDAGWTVDPRGASLADAATEPVAVLGRPPRYPWGMPPDR